MNRLFFTRTGNKIIVVAIVLAATTYILISKLTGRPPLSSILPPCFFHLYTGYNCPGCGATRAINALTNFDFLTAFWYNPMMILFFAIVFLWFLWFTKNAFFGNYKKPFESKLYIIIPILFMVLMILFGFIRNTEVYRQFFY